MQVNVGDIFKAIGPAASIIFAAWIFVGFLQVRYDAAMERYLELIELYRDDKIAEKRRVQLKQNILNFRRRCALMNVASSLGLISAITLVLTLIVGEIAILIPAWAYLGVITVVLGIIGLTLIIAAALIVLSEGTIIHRQLERELLDIPDLAAACGAANSDQPKRKRLGFVR